MIGELSRFVVSGVVCAGVYAFVIGLLILRGASPWFAGALAYIVSMFPAFLLHKHFSFRSSAPYRGEIVPFIASSLVGVVVCTVMPQVLIERAHLDIAASIAATCIVAPAINFILLKTLVFEPWATQSKWRRHPRRARAGVAAGSGGDGGL